MRQVFGWLLVMSFCCAAGGADRQEAPDPRLQEAQASMEEALRLKQAGDYTHAQTQAEHALSLREAVLGATHPSVASCLNLVADIYRRQANYTRAEPLLQRALAIRQEALGIEHPDVAQTLNSLGALYLGQGLYPQAEPFFQRALAIREKALGGRHLDVAQTLNDLAALYKLQGRYGQAEPLFRQALAIREELLGKNHADVAISLNNLASLYVDQNQYAQAEPLLQRALATWEMAADKSPPRLAQTLNNLALVYKNQGLYNRAEPLYLRALELIETMLGKNHPETAILLTNLAHLYSEQGAYARAEPILQRALAIQETALGKNHPDVNQTLNNLAALYKNQGLYGRAEALSQRALAQGEKTFGKNNPGITYALTNLAHLYIEQGLYGRAEPFVRRTLAIQEAALGARNPDVATSLHGLASLYEKQAAYRQAEPLFQRAISIQEATLGGQNPELAASLQSLASLYWKQGAYAQAEPLFQRALAIHEALGNTSADFVRALNGLALLRLAQQRPGDALPLFTRAFALSEQRLRQEALDFSESRLSSFLHYLRADEQRLYALLRAHPGDPGVQRLALSAVLLLKGRSAEETAHISRTLYRGLGPEDRDTFERLRGLRTQLATLSLEGPGPLSPQDFQKRREGLASQGDALEEALARRSAPLRALTALPPPSGIIGRTAAALPEGSALVEFVVYTDSPLVPPAGTRRLKPSSTPRYLALVLLPDATTRAVDLGPAKPLDRAASRLRSALARQDASFQATAQELYRLAFQPLQPLLGSIRRLFLSPDGQLSLVPFAALHDGHGFLVDTFDFVYLTSGRDLLPRPSEEHPTSVFVLSDPDFTSAARAQPSAHSGLFKPLPRAVSARLADLPSSLWVPLPGTRQEAETIQRLLPQAQLFLGAEATKERLLRLPTPGILHLATHGFWLEDTPTPPGSRAVGHFGALDDTPLAVPPPEPLLRSGLAFAGARAPTSGASLPSASAPNAALVTALELAGLDLWGTQLVVLSACDTGRGDVQLGQGVYGLRRALVVAGAETVVMSLWKVDDGSTRLLMDTYYRNLLAGQGRASALREAMRSLRASRPHPHDWAPFIALGSDAPLRLAPAPP
jgi:CHAT domain-containing protein/tetratricopeptide (TPR) repeat protein